MRGNTTAAVRSARKLEVATLLDRPLSRAARVVPEVDALRGVAILAVFVQHLGDRFRPFVEREAGATLPAWLAEWITCTLRHAFWGVDLFFVLSGFSLSLGYLRSFEQGAPAPAVRTFFVRRAARILPAFWTALAVAILAHPGVLHAPGFGAALAAHLALLQGYMSPGGIVFIGALWSLTTEVHFYLAMPYLATPLLRARRGFVAGAAIALAVYATRAVLHAAVLEPGIVTPWLESTQRHWIVSRLDQFVLGMLVARAAAGPWRARLSRRAPLIIALSVALLLLSFRLDSALYLQPHGSWPYALTSMATALLVLGVTTAGRPQAFAPWPLRALGVASYGVFLLHQLVLEGLFSSSAKLAEPSWSSLAGALGLGLALSAAAGVVSWALVERPILRLVARRLDAKHRRLLNFGSAPADA
jgi:peptidoglycan/LPS O-acetylase OafA/YrhL